MRITEPDISRTSSPTQGRQAPRSAVVVEGVHRRSGEPSGYEAVRACNPTSAVP